MRALVRGFAAAACSMLLASMAAAADRAIIVLDASGSMWGQIEGKPKLEIARQTLRTVLGAVPDDLELGLIAYGHRQKGACSDIELVVEPGPGTAAAIADAAGLPIICGGRTALEISRAASRHFAASAMGATGRAHEGPGPASQELRDDVVTKRTSRDETGAAGGFVQVEKGPGLGIEIAWDKVEKYAVNTFSALN